MQTSQVMASDKKSPLLLTLLAIGSVFILLGSVYLKVAGICYFALAGAVTLREPAEAFSLRLMGGRASANNLSLSVAECGRRLGGFLSDRAPLGFMCIGGLVIFLSLYLGELADFYLAMGISSVAFGIWSLRGRPSAENMDGTTAQRMAVPAAILGGGVSIGLYLFFITRYGLNLPYWDDYEVTLGFLNHFSELEPWEKVKTLFQKHYEHFSLVPRTAIAATITLLGHYDFRYLMYSGFAFHVCICLALYKCFSPSKDKILLFLPALICLFQIQHYQAILWGWVATTMSLVFVSTLLSLMFLQRNTWTSLALSLGFAVMGMLSWAAGVIYFPLALAILLYRKRLAHATAWVLAMSVSTVVYLDGFSRPTIPLVDELGRYHVVDFFHSLLGLVATLGEYSEFLESPSTLGHMTAMIAGIFGILGFVYVTMLGYHRKNPALYGFLVFILLSVAAVSVQRHRAGTYQAFSSRYALYSLLYFVCLYLALAESHARAIRALLPFALVGSVMFSAFSYAHTLPHVAHHNAINLHTVYDLSHRIHTGDIATSRMRSWVEYFAESQRNRLYVPPEDIFDRMLASQRVTSSPYAEADSPVLSITDIRETEAYFQILYQLPDELEHIEERGYAAILEGEDVSYRYTTTALSDLEISPAVIKLLYPDADLQVVVPKRSLPFGQYRLGLAMPQDGQAIFSEARLSHLQPMRMILDDGEATRFHAMVVDGTFLRDKNGHFLAEIPITRIPIELPKEYTIEVILKSTGNQPVRASVLTNTPWLARQGMKIHRMFFPNKTFVYAIGTGTQWENLVRFQLEENVWTYLAIRVTEEVVSAHINGVEVDRIDSNSVIRNSMAGLRVGKGSTGKHAFNGTIREIRITDTGFTDEELKLNWDIVKNALRSSVEAL